MKKCNCVSASGEPLVRRRACQGCPFPKMLGVSYGGFNSLRDLLKAENHTLKIGNAPRMPQPGRRVSRIALKKLLAAGHVTKDNQTATLTEKGIEKAEECEAAAMEHKV